MAQFSLVSIKDLNKILVDIYDLPALSVGNRSRPPVMKNPTFDVVVVNVKVGPTYWFQSYKL